MRLIAWLFDCLQVQNLDPPSANPPRKRSIPRKKARKVARQIRQTHGIDQIVVDGIEEGRIDAPVPRGSGPPSNVLVRHDSVPLRHAALKNVQRNNVRYFVVKSRSFWPELRTSLIILRFLCLVLPLLDWLLDLPVTAIFIFSHWLQPESEAPAIPKLHVLHLTQNVTKDHVQEIFGKFGKLKEVMMPVDSDHHNLNRSFADVEYEELGDAQKALKYMNGGQLDGQVIEVKMFDPNGRPSFGGQGRRSFPLFRRGGGGNGGPGYGKGQFCSFFDEFYREKSVNYLVSIRRNVVDSVQSVKSINQSINQYLKMLGGQNKTKQKASLFIHSMLAC